VREYFGALWPAVSGCLVMAAVVISVDRFALETSTPLVAALVKAAVGAVTYSATLLVMHRDRMMRVSKVVRALRAKKIQTG
jgi:hypothetical protein